MLASLRRSKSHLQKIPVILAVDFDNTCSEKDTISLLVDISLECCKDESRVWRSAKWKELVDLYNIEYNSLIEKRISMPSACSSFCKKELDDFMKKFADVDLTSINRILNHSLLSGIPIQSVQHQAREIPMKHMCFNTLNFAKHVHVISSNWSHDLVNSAMSHSTQFNLHCNELEITSNKITTGGVILNMQSPHDKERCIQLIQQKRENQLPVVYVGDSLNDLLAIIKADIGILILKEEEKSDNLVCIAAKKFGIPTVRLNRDMSIFQIAELSNSFKRRAMPQIFIMYNWKELHEVFERSKKEKINFQSRSV